MPPKISDGVLYGSGFMSLLLSRQCFCLTASDVWRFSLSGDVSLARFCFCLTASDARRSSLSGDVSLPCFLLVFSLTAFACKAHVTFAGDVSLARLRYCLTAFAARRIVPFG